MSAWPKIARSAFCCLAFALGPLTAHAQTAEDKAAAEALFDEGRTLMEKGDVAGACRKFEESDRLDTAPGTLLNLAGCYERLGKVASAWATYRRAAPLARERGQTEREKFARTRATELEPRLPRLRILVPDQSKVEGLTIARDGKDLRPPGPPLAHWFGVLKCPGPLFQQAQVVQRLQNVLLLPIVSGMHRQGLSFIGTVDFDLKGIEFDPQLRHRPMARH